MTYAETPYLGANSTQRPERHVGVRPRSGEDGRHQHQPHHRPAGREGGLPGRDLRLGAGEEVQPQLVVAGDRSIVKMRYPDRPGVDLAQSLEDREHRQVDPGARSRLDQRHLRQRRADRRVRAARRRSDQDRPHDLQVPDRRQHRERLPRRDLPPDDDRRPHADLQQALFPGDDRARDRALAALPARAVAGDVRHRPLQEDQRQLRPPRGRLRAQAPGVDGEDQDPPRGSLRALRRRGVRDRAAGDRRAATARRSPRRCASWSRSRTSGSRTRASR